MKNLIIILIACLSLVSCTKEDLGLLRNVNSHNTNNSINGGINTTDYTKTSCLDLDSFTFEITYTTNNNLQDLYYSYINGNTFNSITLNKTSTSKTKSYNKLKINQNSLFTFNFYFMYDGRKDTLFNNYIINVKYKDMTFNVPKTFNADGNLTLTLKASDLIYRNNNQK